MHNAPRHPIQCHDARVRPALVTGAAAHDIAEDNDAVEPSEPHTRPQVGCENTARLVMTVQQTLCGKTIVAAE